MKLLICVIFFGFSFSSFSQDSLDSSLNLFFQFKLEKVFVSKGTGCFGNGGDTATYFKNDNNLLEKTRTCLLSLNESELFFKSSLKSDFNISKKDLQKFTKFNTPYLDCDTGEERPSMNIVVEEFQNKFEALSEEEFQTYLKKSSSHWWYSGDNSYTFILINEKSDSLTLYSENGRSSPY